eukprot:TRINITY_DN4222_c1_g1_i1.p1 TRINITY_DN4222_c1_g1~~TRINITY_DN4222_c1_g1_i1.p1  ORF type:complete len:332 (-),score=31.42 TRINITY_DN4222_c1_g1_i1:247-1113(-)
MKALQVSPSKLEQPQRNVQPIPVGTSKPGVLILPGFLSDARDYSEFAHTLRQRGHLVGIVPVKRRDWWSVICGSSYDFYLDMIQDAIEEMSIEGTRKQELIMVGHSASGWIARLFLGNQIYNGRTWGSKEKVKRLITLGAPHQSLEQYPFGRVNEERVGEDINLPEDVKRSSLRFTNFWYPTGKSIEDVEIVCIAGKAVLGAPVEPSWALLTDQKERSKQIQGQLAYNSYRTGIGRGDVWGDFVTPVDIAHLPDSINLELPDIRHFPQNKNTWYGSELALQQWEQYLQ